MSRIAHMFAFASFAAAAFTDTAAFADAPDYVQIRSLSYAGSGCPAGTVAENISQDLQAFTLTFDDFIAETGPGIPLSAGRKNCQIVVDLDFPFQLVVYDHEGGPTISKAKAMKRRSRRSCTAHSAKTTSSATSSASTPSSGRPAAPSAPSTSTPKFGSQVETRATPAV